jgi:hypothetical protein
MDPISALLIAALVAGYWTRNVVQDFTWKARGEDPPSFRREQERIARREARRPITDKRNARKFWANAWADAWESAGEHRERIHNKRQGERRDRWRVADIEEAEDQAYERNAREPEPTTADNDNGPSPAHCEACHAEVPGDDITVASITGAGGERHLMWACPACVAAEKNRKPQPAATPEPTAQPEPATPAPADTSDTAGGAQIIQFTDLQRIAAGNPTDQENNVNGETTNLSAALTFTSGMASECHQGASSTETSAGGMTAGGVSGPVLTHLSSAQEHLSMAAIEFDAAHADLVNQIAVREAYNANQGAGDKQFVTAD